MNSPIEGIFLLLEANGIELSKQIKCNFIKREKQLVLDAIEYGNARIHKDPQKAAIIYYKQNFKDYEKINAN